MDQINNIQEQVLPIDISNEMSKNLTIRINLEQEIIVTTTDKIRLVLRDTKDIILSKRGWLTPLSLLLSLITTLCTVDFKETLYLSKDTLQAIFVFFSIASFIWLIKTIYKLINYWGRNDLDKIIEQIKLPNAKLKIDK